MRIYSIFQSVNGEVNASGMLSMTTFVRFAGCSANCSFCDTLYAKSKDSGESMSLADVMKQIASFNCNNVTITGGEPFEQRDDLMALLEVLAMNGYKVSVETNGFHPFSKSNGILSFVNWVVDIKNEGPMFLSTYRDMHLTKTDFIKQVVGSLNQMKDAIGRKESLQMNGCNATFAFSPEYGKVTPNLLLQWMKEFKQTDAVLNVQLHKELNLVEDN